MSTQDPTPDQAACPVDHNARTAWLQAAAAQAQPPQQSPTSSSSPLGGSCDSSAIDASPSSQAQTQASRPFRPAFASSRARLSTDRQVSSIPRAVAPPASSAIPPTTSSTRKQPATPTSQDPTTSKILPEGKASPNAQTTTPATSPTGHWIYPSESQFHAALVRKHGAEAAPAADAIPPIIPIHNAVNERTWHDILGWEGGRARTGAGAGAGTGGTSGAPASVGGGGEGAVDQGSEEGGGGRRQEGQGPRLISFSGDSQKLTPRARWYGLLGYSRPFDRHDWVVERRDGGRIDYVIDFYAGKQGGGPAGGMPLSFYLDVRPKLNSFEGVRMRVRRFWGWG